MNGSEQDTPENIQGLIEELGSPDRRARRRASQLLIQEGKAALPALMEELRKGNQDSRLEAAKVLSAIKNPAVAPALIQAIDDDDFGVRWNAMAGLIALERAGLGPLFQALKKNIDSVRLREGAHRVLRVLNDQGHLDESAVKVLEALESIEPEVEVPWAAEAALKSLVVSN